MKTRIILASTSPRRQLLLSQIGLKYEVIESGADENTSGSAEEQVEVLAIRKAEAVLPKINTPAIIIAADTLVTIDGKILGKPDRRDDAYVMLSSLQGKKHTVYTGVSLIKSGENNTNNKTRSFVEKTDVFFRELSNNEIWDYIDTNEPFDKAGGYGIQGLGAAFVSRIEGDFYNVMGLPLSRLYTTLREIVIEI